MRSLKYIISASLIVLAFVVKAQPLAGQSIESIVAKVDNEIILKSELEYTYLQVGSQNPYVAPEDLRCQVLETLIINKLLVAKAAIDSIVVDEAQVNDQLDRRMQFLMQQFGGSPEVVAEKYGKSIDDIKEELRDQVREQLIIQQMQSKIGQELSVTPAEVKTFFKSIPKDSLPYYSLEMEVGQIVKKPLLSEADKDRVKSKLLEIKARIEKGESFEELAKQYSDDPGSGSQGGKLGFFKRGELVPQYEAAALKLKPGELSDIVESQFGFHLIRLDDRRGTEFSSSHILMKINSSQSGIDNASDLLDSLKTEIEAGKLTFQGAAHEYSDDVATKANGGYFTDQLGSTRVPAEELDYSLYFIVNKMKVGEISVPLPFTMEDGTQAVRLVYLKDKVPPHEANLKDDYQKVQAAALQEKKGKAVDEWFKNTKEQIFVDINEEYSSCEILKD